MWKCSACGESIEDDFEVCWNCKTIMTESSFSKITADLWEKKSDEQLVEASENLSRFTEEAEGIIRAELRRRNMPEPERTLRVSEVEQRKPNEASRALVAVGIVIALLGIGLILLSPSLIFHDQVPGQAFGVRMMMNRTTDLSGQAKFCGIFLLIIGGIISAVAFGRSGRNPSIPPQSDSTGVLKICPDCAESVKAAAKICRFCGHKFSESEI